MNIKYSLFLSSVSIFYKSSVIKVRYEGAVSGTVYSNVFISMRVFSAAYKVDDPKSMSSDYATSFSLSYILSFLHTTSILSRDMVNDRHVFPRSFQLLAMIRASKTISFTAARRSYNARTVIVAVYNSLFHGGA